MARYNKLPVLSWGFGLLTLVVLLTNKPETATLDTGAWLFFAALVGLMLNLGIPISDGTVSPAITAALIAYLALGSNSMAHAAVWSTATGSLIGNVVWYTHRLATDRTRRRDYGMLGAVTIRTAQLTLGVYAGGWVYHHLDGQLPLDNINNRDALPLAGFIAAFLAIYLVILLLEITRNRPDALQNLVRHWRELGTALVIPLPFALLGPVIYHESSDLTFLLLVIGLLMFVSSLHWISQNRLRYQQQIRELSSLAAVSQGIRSNLDLNALLGVVCQQATDLLQIDNFTVTLYDPGSNLLHFPIHVCDHVHVPLDPREAGSGLVEHVIRQNAPLLISDRVIARAQAMNLTPPDAPIFSWLGVPLPARERVLGCMCVCSMQPDRHLTIDDLHLLSSIASQVGIAVENAQLYGKTHEHSARLTTLNNAAVTLSGTLDEQHVVELIGSSALTVTENAAVALYLWDEREQLALAGHQGLSDAFVSTAPQPLLVSHEDNQQRQQPILVSDTHSDQRVTHLRRQFDSEHKRAWAEFLLHKGSTRLGILVFYYDEPHSFSLEEVELLRNFTHQAALAISNAHLYTLTDRALDRRVEQLSALADISQELASTFSLQRLFQLVLDRALEVTGSKTGALLLSTDSGASLPSLVSYRGFAPDAFDQVSPLVGLVEETYRTGLPTVSGDVSQEKNYVALDPKTRSQTNVPISRGDDVIGVISLGSDQLNAYSADDLAFVTQLATQARIAIDNVRLFRWIQIDRDRLQIILDSMREGVLLIDANSSVVLANPRIYYLIGLDPEQIINMPIITLLENPTLHLAERLGFRPETLLALVHNLDQGDWDDSTRDAGRITFQVDTPRRRIIDRTDSPVRDENGHVIGLLMVFTDVTHEHDLAQAREDLSNMIVHDLRGPLTAITTSLKLLSEIAPPGDPIGKAVKQTTDTSARATRKLLNLVDSLLDISKLESGIIALDREPALLSSLCLTVRDEMGPLAEELNVDLTDDIPDDLPILDIDIEKTERVLFNLVDNAIKFTPSHGSVLIRARMPGTAGAPHGFIRVDIQDTGPGIPDEYKRSLFERFVQLKGRHGHRRGTGLGLTFCKLAIEAHNGRIWIEDNPQGGTIFAFTLPISRLDR
ncbi:MAG: GAF domain-containing protein [Anaerolineae bacterium]|nr:GAF domain-containing protein [Anaerolineae bacterium]